MGATASCHTDVESFLYCLLKGKLFVLFCLQSLCMEPPGGGWKERAVLISMFLVDVGHLPFNILLVDINLSVALRVRLETSHTVHNH